MHIIYKKVNALYTVTDEKIPSDYAVSRNVYGRVRKFDDVEGAKRRHCAPEYG